MGKIQQIIIESLWAPHISVSVSGYVPVKILFVTNCCFCSLNRFRALSLTHFSEKFLLILVPVAQW